MWVHSRVDKRMNWYSILLSFVLARVHYLFHSRNYLLNHTHQSYFNRPIIQPITQKFLDKLIYNVSDLFANNSKALLWSQVWSCNLFMSYFICFGNFLHKCTLTFSNVYYWGRPCFCYLWKRKELVLRSEGGCREEER